MYSTALGNLVVDKDNSMMHYQKMGPQHPKWAQPGVIQLSDKGMAVEYIQMGYP